VPGCGDPHEVHPHPGKEGGEAQAKAERTDKAKPRCGACGDHSRVEPCATGLYQLLPGSQLRKGTEAGDELGQAETTLHPGQAVEEAGPAASAAETAGLPPAVSVHQDAKLAQRGVTAGSSGDT